MCQSFENDAPYLFQNTNTNPNYIYVVYLYIQFEIFYVYYNIITMNPYTPFCKRKNEMNRLRDEYLLNYFDNLKNNY